VVGRSELPLRDENNGLLPLTAVDVENNTPVAATPVVDGYRRSVYRRRIELLNLNAESI
jgi:hypothetical protein